jgi:hypothetical protein
VLVSRGPSLARQSAPTTEGRLASSAIRPAIFWRLGATSGRERTRRQAVILCGSQEPKVAVSAHCEKRTDEGEAGSLLTADNLKGVVANDRPTLEKLADCR